jgi:uncharacterized MAPEG superfamily protein
MTISSALAALGFLTLFIVGTSIMHTYATQGFAFGFSANRGDHKISPFGLRLRRSLQNHVEATAYAVPALLAVQFATPDHPHVALTASILVLGRALFIPLYWSGVSFIRVPAFLLGTLSSLYLIYLAMMG